MLSAVCWNLSCAAAIVSSTERTTWRLERVCCWPGAPEAAGGAPDEYEPESALSGGAPAVSFGAACSAATEVLLPPSSLPPSDERPTTTATISSDAAASAGIQKLGSASRPRFERGFGKPAATRRSSSAAKAGAGSGESARSARASSCSSRSRGSSALARPSASASSMRARSVSGPVIASPPQLLHGAVQLRADVRLAHPEHPADLGIRKSCLELQRNEVAVARVERRERGAHGLAPHDALRVVLRSERIQVLGVCLERRTTLEAAQLVERGVACDAEQPGLRRAAPGAVAGALAVGPLERLRGHFLGRGAVAQHRCDVRVHPRERALVERLELLPGRPIGRDPHHRLCDRLVHTGSTA